MEQATVKWFNSAKGYGFLRNDAGKDIFVHYSGILGNGYRTLQEGQIVEFEITEGPKGLQAHDVRVSEWFDNEVRRIEDRDRV